MNKVYRWLLRVKLSVYLTLVVILIASYFIAGVIRSLLK